jgi:hypothetical protein
MEKKEITDEEMLEALRICTGADDCDVCPLEHVRDCIHKVLETAFDYIERLQEELDYYKCANRELTGRNAYLKEYSETTYKKAIDREEDAYSLGYDKGEKQATKDTAQKILGELDLFFKGTTFRKGYEFKKIDEKLKELAKRHGIEVE